MPQNFDLELLYTGKTAQNYEKWYSTPYGKYVDKLEKALFLRLVKPKKGQSILDIGCGTGHFSFWFHSLKLKVVGIDISPDMLRVARGMAKAKNIKFIKGDAYSLPFSDNSFDMVVLITTLEFLAQPEQALREAFRVCRKKVFLGVLSRWSLLSFKRKLKALFKKSVYRRARFYSFRELKKLINNCSSTYTNLHYRKILKGAFIGLVIDL